MEREKVKTLIELATSFEQADAVINDYTTYKTDEERIAYLQGMFDCKIVGKGVNDAHTDYVALLTAIINQKWR